MGREGSVHITIAHKGSNARDDRSVPPVYAAKLADVYDAIHSGKDYARESGYLLDVVRRHHPAARTLLETACGTGRFLEALQVEMEVTGLDLSPGMLARAAERMPGAALHVGDMAEFSLGKTFDVVCCLFRSIAYLKTSDRLADAIGTMARHLAPGGIVVIEPFFTPENFWVGRLTCNHHRDESMDITWMYASERPSSRLGRYPIHFLVGSDAGVDHFVEDHELGLFTPHDFQAAFDRAGLSLVYDPVGPTGIGLYIGKRSSRE